MKRYISRSVPAGALALLALISAGFPNLAAAALSPYPLGSRTFVKAAKRLRPSVVHIRVKPRREKGVGLSGFFGPKKRDPQREPRFFEFLEKIPRERLNLGSGLIVSPDGYILTNHHVVKDAERIQVKLDNGEELPAHLVGVDEKTDLALLKIKTKKLLIPAPLGDSDAVEVGEWVIAIGSPFGLAQSVTVGVLSAKSRNLGSGPYDDYLQTDASINPGSSGGPLANSRGEVIGINTAIFSRRGTPLNLGIGFAVPINQAKAVIDDLRHKGYPVRGRLGASIGRVPPKLRKQLGLRRDQGARLEHVIRGGPADRAGLRRGDVIVEFAGKEITHWEWLPRIIARTRPKTEVPVKLFRDAKLHTFKVRLGGRAEAPASKPATGRMPLGFKVSPLTPRLAKRYGIEEKEGLVVTAVERGGIAFRGGVRVGDEIVEVNYKAVKTLEEFGRAMKRSRRDNSVLLLLRRNGTNIFAAIKRPGP